MACSMGTIRKLSFALHSLCVILGAAVIFVNAKLIADKENLDSDIRLLAIGFIVLGSIIILISFPGNCGTLKGNLCLVWTNTILMLGSIVVTIGLIYACRVFSNDTDYAKSILDEAWEGQKNGTGAMDPIQKEHECCGIRGAKDYTDAAMVMPESCYNTSQTTWSTGCLEKLENANKSIMSTSRLVAWVMLVVEIATFTCSTMLGLNLINQKRRQAHS